MDHSHDDMKQFVEWFRNWDEDTRLEARIDQQCLSSEQLRELFTRTYDPRDHGAATAGPPIPPPRSSIELQNIVANVCAKHFEVVTQLRILAVKYKQGIDEIVSDWGILSPTASEEALTTTLEYIKRLMMPKKILVIGDTNAGKSTLINVILGAPLLPIKDREATSAVTEIEYSELPSIRVLRRDGTWYIEELSLAPLEAAEQIARLSSFKRGLTHEERNEMVKQHRKIVIGWPCPLLRSGLVIVDTPGILSKTGEVNEFVESTVSAYMPECCAFLWVFGLTEGAHVFDLMRKVSRVLGRKDWRSEFYGDATLFVHTRKRGLDEVRDELRMNWAGDSGPCVESMVDFHTAHELLCKDAEVSDGPCCQIASEYVHDLATFYVFLLRTMESHSRQLLSCMHPLSRMDFNMRRLLRVIKVSDKTMHNFFARRLAVVESIENSVGTVGREIDRLETNVIQEFWRRATRDINDYFIPVQGKDKCALNALPIAERAKLLVRKKFLEYLDGKTEERTGRREVSGKTRLQVLHERIMNVSESHMSPVKTSLREVELSLSGFLVPCPAGRGNVLSNLRFVLLGSVFSALATIGGTPFALLYIAISGIVDAIKAGKGLLQQLDLQRSSSPSGSAEGSADSNGITDDEKMHLEKLLSPDKEISEKDVFRVRYNSRLSDLEAQMYLLFLLRELSPTVWRARQRLIQEINGLRKSFQKILELMKNARAIDRLVDFKCVPSVIPFYQVLLDGRNRLALESIEIGELLRASRNRKLVKGLWKGGFGSHKVILNVVVPYFMDPPSGATFRSEKKERHGEGEEVQETVGTCYSPQHWEWNLVNSHYLSSLATHVKILRQPDEPTLLKFVGYVCELYWCPEENSARVFLAYVFQVPEDERDPPMVLIDSEEDGPLFPPQNLETRVKWCKELVQCVTFLHETTLAKEKEKLQYWHGCLTLDHFMVANDTLVLFDIADTHETLDVLNIRPCEHRNMAPEVSKSQRTAAGDVYSLGVMMWELLNNRRCPREPLCWDALSAGSAEDVWLEGIVSLCSRCISEDPTKRPSLIECACVVQMALIGCPEPDYASLSPDPGVAFQSYKAGAESGGSEEMLDYALCMLRGIGTNQDVDRGLEQMKRVASAADAPTELATKANKFLGSCYELGLYGVKKIPSFALLYYEAAKWKIGRNLLEPIVCPALEAKETDIKLGCFFF